MIYGLGNIVDNAVDFACSDVSDQAADWTQRSTVTLVIADDGPGFRPTC